MKEPARPLLLVVDPPRQRIGEALAEIEVRVLGIPLSTKQRSTDDGTYAEFSLGSSQSSNGDTAVAL